MTKKWSALDPKDVHPCDTKDVQDETQEAANKNKAKQLNEEYIFIKDSCDVTINTTDTKASINLQAGLQAAIVILISISVADSQTAEKLTQELTQTSKTEQISLQKIVVENSQNVNVATTDTQAAANIQILLQLLLALAVKLDIL
ncbi:spore coat protein [Evansella tamaricis]|uniref:Spore coat protein n=1 Tax=Evansella tamaricis TaxID=2069301 RepID=A0ABS6JF54_9BACI|nr:spore coat protein [Evansella tamaricis]